MILAFIAGCTILHDRASVPNAGAHLVTGVPFFPQAPHQCGPAALASLLGSLDHPIVPEAIAAEIYEPTSAGTSTVAMLAYGSRHQLPLRTLRGSLDDIRSEIDAKRPVIALHRRGFPFRDYHYVVVIGYDPLDGTLYGYSGRNPRASWSAPEFTRRWQAADNWLLVWAGGERQIAPAANRDARAEDHPEPGKRE